MNNVYHNDDGNSSSFSNRYVNTTAQDSTTPESEQYSYPAYTPPKSGQDNEAAALIFGILSLFLFFVPVIPIASAVVGLIFSGTSAKTSEFYGQKKSSIQTAASVCSVIGIILNIIFYMIMIVFPALIIYLNFR